MARIKFVAMILTLFALFTGCNGNINIFDYNLFTDAGVVTPTLNTPPTAAEPTAAAQAATLATMGADLSSPAYLAELTAPGNTATLEAVQTYLVEVYSQPITTTSTAEEVAVVQEAAVLSANLNLDTTGGTTVVQNIVETLMDPAGLDLATDADVSALISSILPDTVTSPETFATLVEGLINASDAYAAFASTLPAGLTAETAATVTIPTDVNMGDVAQKALVSYVVANVVDLWLPAGTTSETATPTQITEAATSLYAFLQDSTNVDAQPTGDVATVLDTGAAGFTSITNLFLVAGLNLSSYLPAGN